jgi:hypothetical protein
VLKPEEAEPCQKHFPRLRLGDRNDISGQLIIEGLARGSKRGVLVGGNDEIGGLHAELRRAEIDLEVERLALAKDRIGDEISERKRQSWSDGVEIGRAKKDRSSLHRRRSRLSRDC